MSPVARLSESPGKYQSVRYPLIRSEECFFKAAARLKPCGKIYLCQRGVFNFDEGEKPAGAFFANASEMRLISYTFSKNIPDIISQHSFDR